MKKSFAYMMVLVVILGLVPSVAHAQIAGKVLDQATDDPVKTAHQPLGEVWTPGYPLVPCGGFVTINAETGDISVPQPTCDFNRLLQLVDNIIIFFAIYMSIPIATIVFAFAGFTYITAGANPGKRSSANSMFTRTIVGLVIALASYLIVHTITSALFTDEINEYVEGTILNE